MVVRTIGVAAAVGLLIGCDGGGGPATAPVTGEVTFDGTPVADGRVLMRKVEGDGKAFSGEIKNGAYSLEAEPGTMAVEITASRPVPGKFDRSNGTPEPVGEMYVPAKYNARTTLKAEVTAGGGNRFPFELVSK